MSAFIGVHGLGHRHGYKQTLADIDLSLNRRDMLCIMGPNGAGKSTLLKAIGSRHGPDDGSITRDSVPIDGQSARRDFLARASYLGHMPGLFLEMSARANLLHTLGLHTRSLNSGQKARIDELLCRVGLAARANDSVRSYSRGMQQRLAIARVFLTDPEIVLLDEPTTGLDREGEIALLRLLEEFQSRDGIALIATHNEEMFSNLATRFLYVRSGRLIADISRDKWNPKTREKVRALLYNSN